MPYCESTALRVHPAGLAIRKPSSSSYSSYPTGSTGTEAEGDAVSSVNDGSGDDAYGSLGCDAPASVSADGLVAADGSSPSSPPPTTNVSTRLTATPTT